MDCEDLGKRLKKARNAKGYTQAALAEKINSAPSYISDIERGIKAPGLATFIELVTVLETSADYILQGSLASGKEHVCDELSAKLDKLTPKQRRFILELVDCYIRSLDP